MSKPIETRDVGEQSGPGGLSQKLTRRRRWPWLVLFTLLLLVGGPVAWRFRPLNASEKRIVGTWRDESGSEVIFEPNRILRQVPGPACTWSASGSVLRYRFVPDFPTSWAAAQIYWDAVVEPQDWSAEVSIEFDERGRLHFLPTKEGDLEEVWERVR